MPPAHGSAPAVVPGYGLAPPTEMDFHLALRRHLGARAGGGAWDDACRACALPAHGRALTQGELRQVAERLMQGRGATAVVGRSMTMRLHAYALLARRAAAGPGPHDVTPDDLAAPRRQADLVVRHLGER
jgi:hypothetical protein